MKSSLGSLVSHWATIAACVAITASGCGSEAPDVFDGVVHPVDAGDSGSGGASGMGGGGGAGGTAGASGGTSGTGATGGTGGEPLPPGQVDDPCPPYACDTDLVCDNGLCAVPRAAEGEACTVTPDCADSLTCVNSVCAADGTEGAPCQFGSLCNEGLGCFDDVCVPTINVRFCHCIYLNGGANTLSLSLLLGPYTIGPTLSNTCTPCQAIPAGNTPLSATVTTPGGTRLLDWSFTPASTWTTALFATDVNGTQVIESHCNAINNLCGF